MAWKAVGILTVLLGFVPMTAPLSAHHSRAMFDVNELVSVEGVVTKVEWRNPHMWVTMDVPGSNGKVEISSCPSSVIRTCCSSLTPSWPSSSPM